MALDYGTKRIGVAVNFSSLVEPVEVITNNLDGGKELLTAEALKRLQFLFKKEEVERLVVGVSEKEMAKKSREFASLLEEKLKVPTFLMDETLSSQEVQKRLIQAQAKLKKRQGPIDHYAAAIILEEWLEGEDS